MPKIYLSPSVQEFNLNVDGVSEETTMNYVADALEPFLRLNGFTVLRNSPYMNISQIISLSNKFNPDLHLALHSNASAPSQAGKTRGSRPYYYENSYLSQNYANIIAKNFKEIYPLPELVKTIPTTSLDELTKTTAPSVLFEIAFHDNREDSDFITNNIQAIARNIAQSVCEIFDKPFIDVCLLGNTPAQFFGPHRVPIYGTVCTEGANLNVRNFPNGTIIYSLPNNSQAVATGTVRNGFIPIRYNALNGFVFAKYLCLCYNPTLPFSARLGVVQTDGGNLNVRQEPTTSSNVIFQIPNGATVATLEQVNNYYRIFYRGKYGYASKDYISLIQ